jgi:outer membrane lipoprotein-sorting protein
MKTFILLLIALVLFLIISCGGKEYTEEGIVEIVEKTDSILTTLEGQEYKWASAKALSRLKAYYPEPDIIFINETLTYRKPGNAFNRYYYKDGKIIHFIGKKLTYFNVTDSKMKKELSDLTLYLDPDGDVISYNKSLNNQLVNLDDAELQEILSHSKELYSLVGDK